MDVKLLFFAGSARQNSLNKKLAKAAALKAEAFGAKTTFLDLSDFPMPLYCGDLEEADGVPDAARQLADILKLQDGVFIAGPEYNSSITPLLKNTLDWVSRLRSDGSPPRTPWHDKVYAVGSTSMGALGGIRVIQTMVGLLVNGYQVPVIPNTIAVPRGHEVLGEDGAINAELMDQLMTEAMRVFVETAGRQKMSS